MRLHKSITVMAAAAVVTSLGGFAASAPASASLPSPQVIHLVGTAKNSIDGMPSSIQAGRVTLSMVSRNQNGSDMSLFKLRGSSYTVQDVIHDYRIVTNQNNPGKTVAAGMRRLNAGVDLFGAPAPEYGHTVNTTLTLYPGTYYWFNGDLPPSAVTTKTVHKLTVFGSVQQRSFPHLDGTVKQVKVDGNMAWSAPATLPHSGTILDRNTTDQLHMMALQQVKKGTTYQQVQNEFDAFMNGQQPKDNVFLDNEEGIDVISPGNQVVVSYDLPAGTYDLECFIPDDQSGVPHAFMGMHRIVVLK